MSDEKTNPPGLLSFVRVKFTIIHPSYILNSLHVRVLYLFSFYFYISFTLSLSTYIFACNLLVHFNPFTWYSAWSWIASEIPCDWITSLKAHLNLELVVKLTTKFNRFTHPTKVFMVFSFFFPFYSSSVDVPPANWPIYILTTSQQFKLD